MDTDRILSLSTGGRSGRRVAAAPSPVLDLIFATYYLRGLRDADREPLAWAADLHHAEPELERAAADLVGGGDEPNVLFAMALEGGYAIDPDPQRFLSDLPGLPEHLATTFPRDGAATDEALPRWVSDPPDAAWSAAAATTLKALWAALLPTWEAEGRPAAEEAARAVVAGIEEYGDVVRALPRRHFAQFETLADKLREAHALGTLLVVPLAFAEGGGFHIEGDAVTAVGFGLHGDRIHETLAGQVGEAAASAKALADPTRLMLLSLITRFGSVKMTVGDLARQLGVSQPTVSGHLKQLREAGLVTTERHGNRTLPKAESEAIERMLDELSRVLRR